MGQLAEGLLSLSGWAALALLLGGVLAQQDRIPLAAALVVGVVGALAGDSVGPSWSSWRSPGSCAAWPGDTTTSHASPSPRAAQRPCPGPRFSSCWPPVRGSSRLLPSRRPRAS